MIQSVNICEPANVVPTVVFRIKISDHFSKPFRAIFDSGAQLNLISHKRVGELQKKRTAVSHNVRGINGNRLQTKGQVSLELYHRRENIRISEEKFVVLQEVLQHNHCNNL